MSLLDLSARRSGTSATQSILARVQAWNDARITRRMLSRLTIRELDDIGLTRADIDRIAARRA